MSHEGDLLARVMKRKRSSDAVSDTTHTTECTEASHGVVDEKAQHLADKRAQHAAERLELEQQLQQLDEQRQHVAVQLEQLDGCESGKDQLGVSDLQQQLKSYAQQHQAATDRLADLDRQFESAVASILGITAEQQPQLLAEALQEQQQLQEVQVQQLAVEQQLAGSDFAVTDSSKHKAKKAKLEKMSSVWDWLHGSSAAAGPGGVGQHEAATGEQQHQHHQQQQQQQPGHLDVGLQQGEQQQSTAGTNGAAPGQHEGQQPPVGLKQQQVKTGQQEQALQAAA